MNHDDDKPASPEELLAAQRLAAALEHDDSSPPSEGAADMAELIRAAAGRVTPLGELRARALAREATQQEATQQEATRQEATRQEATRQEATRQEATRQEATRQEATRQEATQAPRRPRRIWSLALVGVALLLIFFALGRDPVPERLRARSAGLLVPGPFPSRQTAAQRLDRVTSDRLIALREARCRSVSRGAP